MATLSILALYNTENTIFDYMMLPEGVNREVVIGNILLECAELEFLFPSPTFAKQAIGLWSQTRSNSWEKLYKSTKFDYNPIYNYDRTEEWTDATNENNHGTGNGVAKVAGYNSEELVNSSGSESSVNNTLDRQNDGRRRAYGNIGVTTTQQMIMSEREVAVYSVEDAIVQEFKARFCILIY